MHFPQFLLWAAVVIFKEQIFKFLYWEGVVILKKREFSTVSSLGGCGVLE